MSIETSALLVAVLGLVWQMYKSNKMAQLQNFTNYTQRYQDILINLPIKINSSSFELSSQNEELKENTLRWLRAYFDLCSEEYYLNENGFLDKTVWKLWEGGMKDSFNKKAFIEAWEIIQSEPHYAKKFSTFIDNIIHNKNA